MRDQRPWEFTWLVQSHTANYKWWFCHVDPSLWPESQLCSIKQNTSLPSLFTPSGLFLELLFLTRVKSSIQRSQTSSAFWGKLSDLIWFTSSTTSLFILLPLKSSFSKAESWENRLFQSQQKCYIPFEKKIFIYSLVVLSIHQGYKNSRMVTSISKIT